MNPEIPGHAYIDGRELPPCVLKQMPLMFNLWTIGVKVRGFVAEYGRTYTLRVEGFADQDGNTMEPQEFPVKCSDRVLPQEKDAAHEAVALQAAQDGVVLLKNDNNVLPLASGTVLNLFGKAVTEFRTAAVGAGKINPRYCIDLIKAVREKSDLVLNEELAAFYCCDQDIVPPAQLLASAKAQCDTAIFIITRGTGENMDNSTAKGEYYLTDEEDALVKTLSETFTHVIGVLNVGYPVDVKWADTYGGIVVTIGCAIVSMTFPMLVASMGSTAAGWSQIMAIYCIPLAVIGMLRFLLHTLCRWCRAEMRVMPPHLFPAICSRTGKRLSKTTR